jgi:hypothetical protein
MKIQRLLAPWGYKKGLLGAMEGYPCNTLRQTQELTTYLETSIMPVFVKREI